mmetsp:Transcript_3525/g.10031  ORF Transcript_3525/g.10031 Transcript_3525/m.10031 type:complete len:446 (-) Transcript_3525:44-1381(-)
MRSRYRPVAVDGDAHGPDDPNGRDAAYRRGDDESARLVRLIITAIFCAYFAYVLGPVTRTLLMLMGISFQPSVSESETRQVLVVGTQSSGTTSMNAKLVALGLEVYHENANGVLTKCGDGSVSWFHGIRFIEGAPTKHSLDELCGAGHSRSGFSPTMFRAPQTCVPNPFWPPKLFGWDSCLRRECADLLSTEWGCGLRNNGADCATHFARVLLQVRHPLRVIESLAVKFCTGPTSPPSEDLMAMLQGMWPGEGSKFGKPDVALGACFRPLGWYWVLYNDAMLEAVQRGQIHAWYRVEGSKPCEVAALAGFASNATSIRPGAALAYNRSCWIRSDLPSTHKTNSRNLGQLTVTPASIQAIDDQLWSRLAGLASEFGYNLTGGGGDALAPSASHSEHATSPDREWSSAHTPASDARAEQPTAPGGEAAQRHVYQLHRRRAANDWRNL